MLLLLVRLAFRLTGCLEDDSGLWFDSRRKAVEVLLKAECALKNIRNRS